jgi:RNA polymerase sigma-70 factor (ECF subfamily)
VVAAGPGAADGAREPPDTLTTAFKDHYRFVYRMLRQYGVPEAFADDAAQDVFLIVQRRWQDYDGRAAFAKWLLGIVRRVASDYRRAAGRRRRRLEQLTPPGEARDLRRDVEARRLIAMVERFLEGLDRRRREVFVMAELLEMTAPEISQTLGVKLNTVYSRLRIARLRFEAYVRASEGEGEAHG